MEIIILLALNLLKDEWANWVKGAPCAQFGCSGCDDNLERGQLKQIEEINFSAAKMTKLSYKWIIPQMISQLSWWGIIRRMK